MYIIYIIIFSLFFMLLYQSSRLRGFRLIVLLHVFSFYIQFLIALYLEYSTALTIINMLFICLNLFLIIFPWGKFQIRSVSIVKESRYLKFLTRYLRPLLLVNFVVSLSLGIIIHTFFPSAKEFKQEGYLELYDSIPYFANLFRYAYTTQLYGYLAIPIVFDRLVAGDKKNARIWAISSLSSLASGIAFFSRANMLSFVLVYFFFYSAYKKYLSGKLQSTISKIVKWSIISIVAVFILMSYSRFSRMDYLAERIPEEAVVHDITTYYMLNYAGQSFPYGLNSMEEYTPDKCLYGSSFFYNVYQVLGFFHIIDWNATKFIDHREKILGSMNNKFIGYTAESVYDLGYSGTLVVSIIYFMLVIRISKSNRNSSIKHLLYTVILVQIPLNSIFYNNIRGAVMTVLFLFGLNLLYKLEGKK